ncbi:hypothetical protein FOA52_010842 [Chlamydomonas sp. UWO 241]|nr:hypothetical protein FOA52_010842 [Chlamydomonas sp. UWO 241]
MSVPLLNCGTAAATIFVGNLVAKAYMSFGFRAPNIGASKQKKLELENSTAFKEARAAQLNETEWAATLFAALLFLHSKGIDAPVASTLVAATNVMYWVVRTFVPVSSFPVYAPFAVLRYVGSFMLVPALWGAVSA